MNEEKNLVQSNAEKGRLLERLSAGLRCNMGDLQRGFWAESAKKNPLRPVNRGAESFKGSAQATEKG